MIRLNSLRISSASLPCFYKTAMIVMIESYEGTPIRVELPETVDHGGNRDEPTVGDKRRLPRTNPPSWKTAYATMVPPFIEVSDRIVSTRLTEVTTQTG